MGLSLSIIAHHFDSRLASRACPLETGLAVSVEMPSSGWEQVSYCGPRSFDISCVAAARAEASDEISAVNSATRSVDGVPRSTFAV